jgi:CMP-N,N'-diacetyllegionaminic acid synthase
MLQIKEFIKPADHSKPKVIGICPARGGSTRLPNKNMRIFAGRPLIAWTVIQAVNSMSLDEMWVTSDSQEILDCAEKHGARPFLRREHGDDDTPGWVPYLEILKEIARPNDVFVGMFAINPLRRIDDIDNAVKKYFASPGHEEKFLVSVERIHEDFRWQVMNDDYAVPLPPSENELCRYNATLQVCTAGYYDRITREAEDAYYIPYFIEEWGGIDCDSQDQLRLAELVFYDKILRDGLNPYEVYKRGGLKL